MTKSKRCCSCGKKISKTYLRRWYDRTLMTDDIYDAEDTFEDFVASEIMCVQCEDKFSDAMDLLADFDGHGY